MRKSIIIILIVVIAAFVGGIFYLNIQQEKETGKREGLTMGYLYGFNDAKAGSPLNTESLRERLSVVGDSAYEKALLAGAKEGYVHGYAAAKKTE